MPPKRKARLSSRAASTPSGDAAEQPAEETPTPMGVDTIKNELVSDAWTDEQETSLFKGMIRWKPVGMHKHFRMIAISQHLANHGYASPQNGHIRIPGIWEKLGKLYNLEALDAREDAYPMPADGDPHKEPFCPFTLHEEDYCDAMFARRLKPEGSSSPPSLPHQLSLEGGRALRHSTVDDTDDARSSPASIRRQPAGRNTRASKGSRTSQLRTRGGSMASVDQVTEDDQRDDEEAGDAMEVGEDDSKDPLLKNTISNVLKLVAAKSSTRKSGRRR